MNKETNKLLADFLGVELIWADYWNSWSIKNTFTLWKPDSDWNQLMQVIDKIKYTSSEKYDYECQHLLDTPIGNDFQLIYCRTADVVKLLMNESPINPE